MNLNDLQREIDDLHTFFADWFGGNLPPTDAAFARFPDSMTADFTIVGPDGRLRTRDAIVHAVRDGYGRRPGVAIWTENHQLLWQTDDAALCLYEEWQRSGAETTGRLSSVLFSIVDDQPRWRHVHETWLPGAVGR